MIEMIYAILLASIFLMTILFYLRYLKKKLFNCFNNNSVHNVEIL
jgi:hypothetical protein